MVDDDFFFIPLHFPCPCLSLLRSWLVFVIYPFAHWRSLYVYMNMRMQFECQCYRSSLFFGVIWSTIHIIWSLCIYYLLLYQWSIQFIAFNQNKFFITSNYLTFSQMVGSVFHHQHRLKKKSGFVHHIQVDTQVESIIYDDDDNKRHLVKCFFFSLNEMWLCWFGRHWHMLSILLLLSPRSSSLSMYRCRYGMYLSVEKNDDEPTLVTSCPLMFDAFDPLSSLSTGLAAYLSIISFFFYFVTDDHLIFHYRNCIRNSNPDVVKDVRPWPSTKKQEQF